jgi:hypothetical protein
MLISSRISSTATVNRLVTLWAERYQIKLERSALLEDPFFYQELLFAASPQGRKLTTEKLRPGFINISCELASLQSRSLYEYIPNVLQLTEAKQLAQSVQKVYLTLLDFYQTSGGSELWLHQTLETLQESTLIIHELPIISEFAQALEPSLLEAQQHHRVSRDWRTLGFLTTIFNFTNHLLLGQLNSVERLLINPYFNFVEEHVAIPWQRVCVAAANHLPISTGFLLVEKLFPQAQEIAELLYLRLVEKFPNQKSRRGKLSHPGIRHSCIRDFNMFQAYLFLCILERDGAAIERELVQLCIMVMESVEVAWEVIDFWIELLSDELLHRLVTPEQRALLTLYTESLRRTFSVRQLEFRTFQTGQTDTR